MNEERGQVYLFSAVAVVRLMGMGLWLPWGLETLHAGGLLVSLGVFTGGAVLLLEMV